MSKEKGHKKLVPELRFSEFEHTEGWSRYELGDFVNSHKGGAPLKPKDFVPKSDYEVIPKKAITSGAWLKLDKKSPTYCTEEFFSSYKKSVVDNSYLITTLRDLVPSGPNIGYIVKYSENKKYILAQGVYGIKLNNRIVSDFLLHFSNTPQYRKLVNSIMVGSTQVHIRNGDFFRLPLFVPSLPEQQKIAATLTSLDHLISAENEKLDALQAHKKGLLQQLFPAKGEKLPKLRFGEFRGEWEENTLGEIGEIITGKTPNTKNEALWNGEILFITPTDISEENKYQLTTKRTIKRSDKLKTLPVGSIAFTCIASIGKITLTSKESTTNQQINSIIPFPDYFNEYIYYALINLTPWIKSIPATSTLPIINKSEFSGIQLCFPPTLEEQQKIANCLSSLDETITAQSEKIESLKEHKKGLMQQLFPLV